jgi:hypothetical protein
MVFLAPEEPIAPLGSIPEADDPSFEVGELPTLVARASAGLLADNFLDVAHFPFVHAGTFGADEAAEVPHYAVARDDWSFTMSYEHSFANREDPGVAAGVRPLVQTRRLSYRLSAPFHLAPAHRLRRGPRDQRDRLLHPARDGRLVPPLHHAVARRPLWRPGRMAEAVEFEVAVLREDLRIQEAFHELVLPLEPTAEVHTRADRTTLELRRVLADLVPRWRGAVDDVSAPEVVVVDHPVLAHRVTALRDRRTDRDTFRQLVGEITHFLAYEALPDLGMSEVIIDTPVADGVAGPPGHREHPGGAGAAGRTGHGPGHPGGRAADRGGPCRAAPRRDDAALGGVPQSPAADLDGRRVIVCDPMVATGGSLVQVCDLVRERGAKEVIVLCIIASAPGIAASAPPTRPCGCSAPPWTPRSTMWATSCRGWATPGTGCSGPRTEPVTAPRRRFGAVPWSVLRRLRWVWRCG